MVGDEHDRLDCDEGEDEADDAPALEQLGHGSDVERVVETDHGEIQQRGERDPGEVRNE
jgi:hypothetical protein